MKAGHPDELSEIYQALESVNAEIHRTKKSKEKTKRYRMLYSPRALNKAFKTRFEAMGWKSVKVSCDYPAKYYVPGYNPTPIQNASREMDFIKNRVGIEIQLGKYAFMVYNVAAKMTIFHNLRYIDVGVEIVPAKELQLEMSTGVSYFEQFVWDLRAARRIRY
jgi:hypothetical protein